MKQLLRYAALVILLASIFFIARAIDDNDRWRGCEIDSDTATCTFIQPTTRRGGEVLIDASCAPPVLRENNPGYKHVCTFQVQYVSHIIEETADDTH